MTSHDDARPLTGKVALVTGAGRGLGRAFAERLASLGADIAIHGMRENGPAEYGEGTDADRGRRSGGRDHGVRTISVLGDLTRGAQTSSGSSRPHRKALGPIEILVHNAGGDIAAAGGKPDPNDAVDIQRGGRARGARPQFAQHHPDLSGGGARHDGTPLRPHRHYRLGRRLQGPHQRLDLCGVKAGVTHYTRCLADQLRPYDITVNCIAPGDTRTGRFMGTRAVDQTRLVETGTLDRIATVDEVARVVEVFAGPLGAFVSGQVLRVDGGGQCWPG